MGEQLIWEIYGGYDFGHRSTGDSLAIYEKRNNIFNHKAINLMENSITLVCLVI